MEASDRVRIEELADVLADQGFHARLMMDGDVPVLFALGVRKNHSVDLRRAEGELVIEFWNGYPDDEFIRADTVQTFEEALPRIQRWLARDPDVR